MKAFTDYPFRFLGDTPGQEAPVRPITVLYFDGSKYCGVKVAGHTTEIKAGYIYQKRTKPFRTFPLHTLRKMRRQVNCEMVKAAMVKVATVPDSPAAWDAWIHEVAVYNTGFANWLRQYRSPEMLRLLRSGAGPWLEMAFNAGKMQER